ncbi:MAG TPA: heme NO-binding domain-containing protein [Burkholderiales bacterium]|nr:heme NO-binding domain-containing protein [Burkholderiales bacterium]
MNGIVFLEIGKFARSRLGEHAWREVVRLAGVPSRIYYRVADYPDQEAAALVSALAAALNEPLSTVLENLGEFITPDLLRMARSWIKPEWKTLDLIANTEATIHETLRAEGSQTNPPRLRCERTAPDEVVVTYDSPRRLCSLARGIVRGVARHYAEQVAIAEPSCMLKGDAACRLVVKCQPL